MPRVLRSSFLVYIDSQFSRLCVFIGHRIMHAYANFVGYDVTNITFRTFQWYKSRYNDVPRSSHFTCEGLASQTRYETPDSTAGSQSTGS